MGKLIDLTGQKFNHLTVLERDYDIPKEHPNERISWWKCYCDVCKQTKSLRSNVIRKAQTCGCKLNSDKNPRKEIKIKPKSKENFRGINLIGQRFTRLLVLEYADENHQVFYGKHHKNTWKCLCDCGNICYATTENLRRGDTPSCGCITKENGRAKLNDLSGQKFGHLLVLKWIGTVNNNSKYLVRCDCGKEYEIYAGNLTQGCTTSCGCVKESRGEQKIRQILIENNINFITQKTFSDFRFKDTNGIPKYDFYLPDYNILIEYDGEQHFKSVYSWDTKNSFKQRRKHDEEKNNYALNNNYLLIRIPYTHYNKINIKDLLDKSDYIIKRGDDLF